MNLLSPVFFVGISVLGGGCIVYKSYNPAEKIAVSSKKSSHSKSNPLEIKQIPNLDLTIIEPVAVS